MLNTKKFAIICLSLIPNAYLIKSVLDFLPDVTLVLYIICYCLCLVGIFNNKRKGIGFGLFDLCVILFITLLLISLTYSPYPNVGIIKISKVSLLGFGLVYLVRFFVRNKNDFDLLLKSYLVGSLILGIVVLVNFITLGMPFGRFSFYGAHPIPLSMMGSVALLIGITFFVNKKINLLYFAILSGVNVWVILVSSSRGPLLSLIIVLILIVPSLIKNFKKFLGLTLIILIVFYYFSKTTQYEFLKKRLEGMGDDKSSMARFYLYDQAEKIISKNPFMGNGIGVFNDKYPHNIFLEVYADSGILAVILVAVLFLWIGYKYITYLTKNRANYYFFLPIGLTLIPVIVLLYSFTYMDLKFLYIGLGLVLAQQNFHSENQRHIISAKDLNKFKDNKRVGLKKYKISW